MKHIPLPTDKSFHPLRTWINARYWKLINEQDRCPQGSEPHVGAGQDPMAGWEPEETVCSCVAAGRLPGRREVRASRAIFSNSPINFAWLNPPVASTVLGTGSQTFQPLGTWPPSLASHPCSLCTQHPGLLDVPLIPLALPLAFAMRFSLPGTPFL